MFSVPCFRAPDLKDLERVKAVFTLRVFGVFSSNPFSMFSQFGGAG